jgi:hypothetical protein
VSIQNEDISASKFDQIRREISNTNIPLIGKTNSHLNKEEKRIVLLVQHDKDFVDQEMRIYKDKVHVEINE